MYLVLTDSVSSHQSLVGSRLGGHHEFFESSHEAQGSPRLYFVALQLFPRIDYQSLFSFGPLCHGYPGVDL